MNHDDLSRGTATDQRQKDTDGKQATSAFFRSQRANLRIRSLISKPRRLLRLLITSKYSIPPWLWGIPYGALPRLVDLLNKLDPNNRRWKEQQLERARQDRELAEQMQDEVNRENALEDIETRIKDIERSFDSKFHELDFARKLYLIENCIYGVDIQPIACQIAKLRFFIALIVDQKVDLEADNLGRPPVTEFGNEGCRSRRYNSHRKTRPTSVRSL